MSSPTASPQNSRLITLDAVRFLAAASVVLLHGVKELVTAFPSCGEEIATFGRFAVPYFTAIAACLVVDSFVRTPSRKLGTYTWNRFNRVFLPFLVWTVIYIVLRQVKLRYISHEPLPNLNWITIVGGVGASHHLWFPPFNFYASVIVAVLAKLFLTRISLAGNIVLSIACAAGGAWISIAPNPWVAGTLYDMEHHTISFSYMLMLVWNAIPSALVGVAVGCYWSKMVKSKYRSTIAWSGAILFVVAMTLRIYFQTTMFTTLDHLAGLGAVLMSLATWNNSVVRTMARWGNAAYGIYLIHIAIWLGLEMVVKKKHVPENWITVPLMILATIVLATALSIWISRIPYIGWIMGVEGKSKPKQPPAGSQVTAPSEGATTAIKD